ncbi:MAG: hypothetical protein AB1591_10065 [Pseudomonadota bacterium]
MIENLENLVLEHLRHIRGKVDQISDDVATVKMRLNSLEKAVAGFHEDLAIISGRLDRVESRIDRVEKRLELAS